jgi:hypothetical protein
MKNRSQDRYFMQTANEQEVEAAKAPVQVDQALSQRHRRQRLDAVPKAQRAVTKRRVLFNHGLDGLHQLLLQLRTVFAGTGAHRAPHNPNIDCLIKLSSTPRCFNPCGKSRIVSCPQAHLFPARHPR